MQERTRLAADKAKSVWVSEALGSISGSSNPGPACRLASQSRLRPSWAARGLPHWVRLFLEREREDAASGEGVNGQDVHLRLTCERAIGEPSEATRLLQRARRMRLPNYPLFRNDPHFQSLRNYSPFPRLMRSLKSESESYKREFGRT